MPYNHASEIGDVWKHLPLCEILKIEKPLTYHESNSAYSGYTLSISPRVEYGVLKLLGLNNDVFMNSEYYHVLKRNGIDNLRYTGSPGLAMEVLSNRAQYYFHDIEREALEDVEAFAQEKGLSDFVKTICGDSICAFTDNNYVFGKDDFLFLDPYTPFDVNDINLSFFDIFTKGIARRSKTLLWYGYESLSGQKHIFECLEHLSKEHKVEIWSFDIWLKSMNTHGCEINPGVPGCGLACVHLSKGSINIMKKYLSLIESCYMDATYCGHDATLLAKINTFTHL